MARGPAYCRASCAVLRDAFGAAASGHPSVPLELDGRAIASMPRYSGRNDREVNTDLPGLVIIAVAAVCELASLMIPTRFTATMCRFFSVKAITPSLDDLRQGYPNVRIRNGKPSWKPSGL